MVFFTVESHFFYICGDYSYISQNECVLTKTIAKQTQKAKTERIIIIIKAQAIVVYKTCQFLTSSHSDRN